MSNEVADSIIAAKKQIQREIAEGGALKDWPCPFCGLPRCLRSDYLRCQKCGVNWWAGTDLTKNPHASGANTGNTILRVESGTVVLSKPTDQKPSTYAAKKSEQGKVSTEDE